MSILVVEDDRTNGAAMVSLLQYGGFLAESARSVNEAMQKVGPQVQVVLLDIELPDGSGEQVLRYIRSQHPQVKVGVLTGSIAPRQMSSLHADATFMKPVKPAEVLQWVERAMADGDWGREPQADDPSQPRPA